MRLSIARYFIAALLLLGGLHVDIVLAAAVTPGYMYTVAGTGVLGFSGDSSAATKATMAYPKGVAVDSAGNLYIADYSNNRIRMVSPTGIITSIVGTGVAGYSGDKAAATKALISAPTGVAVDGIGNIYIADYGNNVIRMVAPNGIISTVAGTGVAGYSGDAGLATLAKLNYPYGIAVDGAGNLYIADSGNNVIRMVSGGNISTIVGTGTWGYSGDNAAATAATLRIPNGVAVDGTGNLYIADSGNNVIRMVTGGTIITVAGSGIQGYSGDNGPATKAMLAYPKSVAVDGVGNLYIADFYNNRIRKVSGSTITTVAGSGIQGYSGDAGLATLGTLYEPNGVAVNGAYNLYIADYGNNAVRMVAGGSVLAVSQSDCIFNWAEKSYIQYFAPAGAMTQTFPPYRFRYYSGTGNYVATSSADNHVYVVGTSVGNNLLDVGPIASFLGMSGCQ